MENDFYVAYSTLPNGNILIPFGSDYDPNSGVMSVLEKPNKDKIIKEKLDNVLFYITSKFQLNEQQSAKLYIAGGAIRSMLLDEPVKDYDIFLEDDEIRQYLLNKADELGIFYSDNAISLYTNNGVYQIVTTKTGYPWDVVNEFDFVMNQNYYYKALAPYTDPLYIADKEVIMSKSLKINQNCRNKLGTLARLAKFLDRGYTAPSRMDLVALGISLTKCNPVGKLSELKEESKLFFTSDDCYELFDNGSIESCSDEEIRALNNRGSGL